MTISIQIMRDRLQSTGKKKNHRATERWLETLEKPQFNRTSVFLRVPARKQDTDTMQ